LLYWLLYLNSFIIFRRSVFFGILRSARRSPAYSAFHGLIVGPIVIRRLRDFQIGSTSAKRAQAHQKKAGPTMGGC